MVVRAASVVNESFLNPQVRQHVRVGVAYGSNTALVREVLLKVALDHEEILKNPSPIVIFEDFGSSSLDFDLRFWTNQVWEVDRVCSEIRFQIDSVFREKGVEIPFPQRDVHLKGNWPL